MATDKFQAAKKKALVKYKKILLKELQFDKGDNFFERGQFGDVKRAKWNDQEVAIKCFTTADRKGGFSEELVNLSILQGHESIVKMHGACVSEHPFIVLEFAPLSLEKVIHECKKYYRYTADHVISWSYQAAIGLDYVHGKNLLHRDVKPSNMLLFDKGKVLKLCDFGTAKKLEHTLTNAVGTIRYMAPEVIRGRYYTDRCDVFSFGIVVWEMIARRRPTLSGTSKGNNNMAILYAMANGARPPKFSDLPKVVSEMIDECWNEEPQKRPTISEIKLKLKYLCKFVELKKPLVITRRQPCSTPVSKNTQDGSVHSNQEIHVNNSKVKVEPEKNPGQLTLESGELEVVDGNSRSPIPPLDLSTLRIDGDHPPQPVATLPQHIGNLQTLPPITTTAGNLSPNQALHYDPCDTPQNQDLALPQNPPLLPYRNQSPLHPPNQTTPLHLPNQSPLHPQTLSPLRLSPLNQSPLHIPRNHEPINRDLPLPSHQDEVAIDEGLFFRSRFTRATEGSPYYIKDLDAELQAILPNDTNQESLHLYQQFKEIASEVVETTRKQDKFKEEVFNLEREINEDRQRLEVKEKVQRKYQEKCSEKGSLVNELKRLQSIYSGLKENVT